MTDEQRKLAYMLLETHDVKSTLALMRQSISGDPITYRDVDSIRGTLIARQNPPQHLLAQEPGAIQRAAVTKASEALLRAQLRTGQHWITDAGRFARACASVGLPA